MSVDITLAHCVEDENFYPTVPPNMINIGNFFTLKFPGFA